MVDIDAILAPIPGDNPAGEDLRYESVYDEIKEARRADDLLDRGDWDREIKTADWNKALALSVEILTERTKDLQVGAWLTEALVKTEGFEGLAAGLKILTGFLNEFWDNVYPEIDEGDLEYRLGPLEFLNNNLWLPIKEIPITDPRTTPGYSWSQWQESRQVGLEKDLYNEYDEVDERKKAARAEMIADGKLPAEDFDGAVAASSKAFYVGLEGVIASCVEGFKAFDQTVDEKFKDEGPRLSELKQSIEDCELFLTRTLKTKREQDPDPEPEPEVLAEVSPEPGQDGLETEPVESSPASAAAPAAAPAAGVSSAPAVQLSSNIPNDSDSMEQAFWNDAVITLESSGVKEALAKLLHASSSAPSKRQQSRYRLLIVRLCIRAGKPQLARPVIEELHGLIEQLGLEQWESPMWIAEVLDAYYQILTAEGAPDEDFNKANYELYPRICKHDITKAMKYKE